MAMKIHKSVTADRVFELVKAEMIGTDNPGICLACGEDADGCEPDARGYTCEVCDRPYVYGAEEIMMQGLYYGRKMR